MSRASPSPYLSEDVHPAAQPTGTGYGCAKQGWIGKMSNTANSTVTIKANLSITG
ncbi:MAG: hypothetical protein KME25_30455 [Symplocastrum torsivum CPER-KK1]|uniref:Uncharacterized protein n=1 Tax=Symplocastrum torsivum CPER-KK1 TaxID=450513 RepID=A0A951PTQ7_9CYAN|nr:hypothetical protein [Symplocastrum torsivum CPER-KK1]